MSKRSSWFKRLNVVETFTRRHPC